MKLDKFTVHKNSLILDVLKKIDENLHGFVLVVDDEDTLHGVMTDGDVRRLLVSVGSVNQPIRGRYNKNYIFIDVDTTFLELVDMFQSNEINYIPILDGKTLVNVITKEQFHNIVLRDQKFDPFADLSTLILGDGDIHMRPWGFYKSTFLNKYSQSKIIFIFPGQELSLQEHQFRDEHWIVSKGVGEVVLGKSVQSAQSGRYFFIPRGCKHKVRNLSTDSNMIITEVQLGNYFGEDDIIRYEDIYGRV